MKLTNTTLIVLTACFLMLFGNISLVSNVLTIYPINSENIIFLFSLIIFFIAINIILFSLVCIKKTTKPVLIVILIASSLAAYFMDTYHVVIDDLMIDNIIKTDVNEAIDLLSLKQFMYVILLGIFPSILIFKAKITKAPLKKAIVSNVILFVSAVLISILLIFSLNSFYASFFREHKQLRFYANPSYYVYSGIKHANSFFKIGLEPLKKIGEDAHVSANNKQRKLVIFVVGETARSDHFSLNGYDKETNAFLKKEGVLSFDNVSSCGTSTAYSVPCMFSLYGRSDFNKSKGKNTENVLDILNRAGVNVIWLDNNSSSKGVADRVSYQSYKSSDINSMCDIECRDEGMLKNLQSYIDKHSTGDIFIVLHQMGNHGPAYYKRYPKRFEAFTPTCKTNQLEQCSEEEINNAYDNALRYTDYFLSQTIQFLKTNDSQFAPALFYASDHGESLGENNLFLHGLPYVIAPKEQTRVPMIMWFGKSFDKQEINFKQLLKQTHKKLSHDNIFHTILGLLEIKTKVYDDNMDIIKHENGRNH